MPGWQPTPSPPLPELGQERFCPRGTWSCRVSWLLAQRSVSSKGVKFSSKRKSLKYSPENRSDVLCSFLINFPVVMLNEELGSLAQSLSVPVHKVMSKFRGTSQHHLLLSCFDQVFGVWVTSESTRPVGVHKKAEGRAEGKLLLKTSSPGFCLREGNTSQKLLHCVQDSPVPRKQSHTTEEPGAHGSIRNPRLLLAGGGSPRVSGVTYPPSGFPDWSICL